MAHLTPEAPSRNLTFTGVIPDTLMPHLLGALGCLLSPYGWEKFGSMSADDAAQAMNVAIETIREGGGSMSFVGASYAVYGFTAPFAGGSVLAPLNYNIVDRGDFGYKVEFDQLLVVPAGKGGLYQVTSFLEVIPSGYAGTVQVCPWVLGAGNSMQIAKASIPAVGDPVTLETSEVMYLNELDEIGLAYHQTTGEDLSYGTAALHLIYLGA